MNKPVRLIKPLLQLLSASRGLLGRKAAPLALLLLGVSLAVCAVLSLPRLARAAPDVLYAAPEAQGSGDCSSWEHACTLSTALTNAQSGDEIWVMRGVHYPDTTNLSDPREATFSLKSGVAVYGGFAGTETSRDDRDPQANLTVLSGDIGGDDLTDPNDIVTTTAHISGTNAYHVVTAVGVTGATLDGFVITAGQANHATQDREQKGGGLYCSGGSGLTLKNITFSGNLATTGGGGMYVTASSPALENVTFSGNSAGVGGGGMDNVQGSNPTLTNVTFVSNTANTGGGLYNYASSPTLITVTFRSNVATTGGGGMDNVQNSNPTLTNVTFVSNTADAGGGLYNYASSPTLISVTFRSNVATTGGGGMDNVQDSNPTLTNVLFEENRAQRWGGGMFNYRSRPQLTSVNFVRNVAAIHGGGIYNNESSPTLTDVTFVGNSAGMRGGGMNNYLGSNAVLRNVTFRENVAGEYGGALRNYEADPVLEDVSFISNTARYAGGGVSNFSSRPVLTGTIFISNTAVRGGGMDNDSSSPRIVNGQFLANSASYGGAMANMFGAPYLVNVLFSGNAAQLAGGALSNDFSDVTLINVSLSRNTAGLSGGGMYNYGNSSLRLTNAILWGNSAGTGPELFNVNAQPSIAYSDVRGCGGSSNWNSACGSNGGGNIDADPRFVNAAAGDLHLGVFSPCIDAGSNAAVPSGVTTDLDGNPRIANSVVDMGAYEWEGVLLKLYVPLVLKNAP